MRYREADLEARVRVAQFRQELAKLGWIEGRNVQIEERWVDLANTKKSPIVMRERRSRHRSHNGAASRPS
jgi:hypothetical protein